MTSSPPHVDDLLGAYALDALAPVERRRVEDHLQGCSSCREDLRELGEATTTLSEGLELAPPPQLRARVLQAVATEPQSQQRPADRPHRKPRHGAAPTRTGSRGSKALWGLAAAGLLAVGGWGIWQGVGPDLSPVDEVIQADDAQRFQIAYEGEQITVVTSGSLDRAVLRAADLPDLADDHVYQAWWVSEAGSVTSAGVLPRGSAGSDVEDALEGDPQGRVALALSVEPPGGSSQPTSEPILSVPIQG